MSDDRPAQGRTHVAFRLQNGSQESTTSVITTWTPGTTLEQAEETIKAAARQAVADVRERFRG